MTDNEEAEFAQLMGAGIKQCVVWYRDQDFSRVNEDARAELEVSSAPATSTTSAQACRLALT